MELKNIKKMDIIHVISKFINKNFPINKSPQIVIENCWYNNEIDCWVVDSTERYTSTFPNSLNEYKTLIDENYFEILLGKNGVWQTHFDEKVSKDLKHEWNSFLKSYKTQNINDRTL